MSQYVSVEATVYDDADRKYEISGEVDWLGNVDLSESAECAIESGVSVDEVRAALINAAMAAFEAQYEDSQCEDAG